MYTDEYYNKYNDRVLAFLVGKVVLALYMSKDKTLLTFKLNDDTFFTVKAEGDCCSSSWFEHISGVDELIEHKITSVSNIDLSKMDIEDRDDMRLLQHYGYEVVTTKGRFLIEMRNESNGYYGGDLKRHYPADSHTDEVRVSSDF